MNVCEVCTCGRSRRAAGRFTKCGGGRRALENCFWVAAAAANTLLESVLYSYFTGLLSGDRGIGLAPPGGQLEKLQCEKRSADVTSVGGIGASPSHTCFTVCSRLLCFVRHSVRPSRFTIVSVRSLCAECRAFCVASAWQLSVVASVDRHVLSPRVLSLPCRLDFPASIGLPSERNCSHRRLLGIRDPRTFESIVMCFTMIIFQRSPIYRTSFQTVCDASGGWLQTQREGNDLREGSKWKN